MGRGYGERAAGQSVWLAASMVLVATLLTVGGWLAFVGLDSGEPANAEPPAPPALTGEVAFGAPQMVEGVPWGSVWTGMARRRPRRRRWR